MLGNSRGNAMIEIIPIIAIFILLVNFSLGFFGLIHSGIMNSIGARNYAFETFRNRADLRYLRDTAASDKSFTYTQAKLRFHAIQSETVGISDNQWHATKREIKFSDINGAPTILGSSIDHNRKIQSIQSDKEASAAVQDGVSPAWLRTLYGICLETKCGR